HLFTKSYKRSPSAVLQSYLFFRPLFNEPVRFFFDLFLNKFITILLGKIIKVVRTRYVNEHVVPFNKRTKAAFTFCDRLFIIETDWCIFNLFGSNDLHGSLQIYLKKIFSFRNRNKLFT